MNIDQAIKVNTVLKGAPVLKDDPKIIEALQLGIEALKWIKDNRVDQPGWVVRCLPGETEE